MSTSTFFPSDEVLRFVLSDIGISDELIKTVPSRYLGGLHKEEIIRFIELEHHMAPTILKAFDLSLKEVKDLPQTKIRQLFVEHVFTKNDKAAYPVSYAVNQFYQILASSNLGFDDWEVDDDDNPEVVTEYPGYPYESKVLDTYLHKKMWHHPLRYRIDPTRDKYSINTIHHNILTDFVAKKISLLVKTGHLVDKDAKNWLACAEAYKTLRSTIDSM